VIQYVSFFSTWTDLMFVQGEGGPDMPATPDSEDFFCPAAVTGSTSATPLTSSVDSGKVKYDSVSKTPSRASTPKSRSMLKRTLQDAFAEGSAKENQILERLGTQKHECEEPTIGPFRYWGAQGNVARCKCEAQRRRVEQSKTKRRGGESQR
jgi:hypothetical protein